MRRERERCRRQSRERIPKDGQRLAALQAIGEMAGGKLCEAGKSVRDAFDSSEPDRACSDGSQERREYSCCRFMAPVAEQAGQADADNSAIQPGLFFCGIGHETAVYS